MKGKLILLAVILHLLIKLFWDFIGDDLYYATMSVVLFLWAASTTHDGQTKVLKIFISWWLFWLGNDIGKEVGRLLHIPFFFDPTKKHLTEYIMFGMSSAYLAYQLLRPKVIFILSGVLFILTAVSYFSWDYRITIGLASFKISLLVAAILKRRKC